MNRHDRRKAASTGRVPEDIFPGAHGPVQPNLQTLLPKLMETLEACLPGFGISLFIHERLGPEPGVLPRFNYISNGQREDMVAVLKAFVAKNTQLPPEVEAFEKDLSEMPVGDTQQ